MYPVNAVTYLSGCSGTTLVDHGRSINPGAPSSAQPHAHNTVAATSHEYLTRRRPGNQGESAAPVHTMIPPTAHRRGDAVTSQTKPTVVQGMYGVSLPARTYAPDKTTLASNAGRQSVATTTSPQFSSRRLPIGVGMQCGGRSTFDDVVAVRVPVCEVSV